MSRFEVNLGELAQVPVGAHRRSAGSLGARENPQLAEFRQTGHVPPKRSKPPKPPLCKTCGDRECVGNCRF
jgi:hypothetical protein